MVSIVPPVELASRTSHPQAIASPTVLGLASAKAGKYK
jgi:hypothetical protein